jgi:uncharacterized membrane protein YedE/YeeE
MLIDWQSFTPLSAAIGGALIGLAASILILFNGRVAGISGIVSGLMRLRRGDIAWRAMFVAGLLAAGGLQFLVPALPAARIDASYALLCMAGLLVGVGTRLGSGCTSGHGVCGLARLSPRSLAATLTFMAAGIVSVYVMRHLFGS